jgi:hypothetical protein
VTVVRGVRDACSSSLFEEKQRAEFGFSLCGISRTKKSEQGGGVKKTSVL